MFKIKIYISITLKLFFIYKYLFVEKVMIPLLSQLVILIIKLYLTIY